MTARLPDNTPADYAFAYTFLLNQGQTIVPTGFVDVTPEDTQIQVATLRPKQRVRHALSVLVRGHATIREDEIG